MERAMRHRRSLITLFVALALASAAVPLGPADPEERVLRFALTPSEETTEQQIKRSQQVIQRLERDLSAKVVPYTAGDFVSVIEAMRSKKVDFAWLGAFSYVLAAREAGAEAFATGVRKSTGKATYASLIFVKADAPYRAVTDLKGRTFGFVDPASTSGHLFPRAAMVSMGIAEPEKFFGRVVFAGAHDAVQLAVLNGKVDAGASNDRVMDNLMKRGTLKAGDLRILHRIDSIPLGPLAYRRDLPAATKEAIRSSFLGMKNVTFGTLGELTHFVEVSDRTYDVIRETARVLNLDLQKIGE
jgi:phosphonate transport system substrate-binding protein